MPHEVFISHASADKPVANAICRKLEEAGVRCWIAPRDIDPGANWIASIIEGLKCPMMVLVFSQHANESDHVQREVERAFAKKLIVIPFRVEQAEPKGGLEFYLSSVQWLDAVAPPLEEHLETLAARAKFLLARAGKAATEKAQHAPVAGPAIPEAFLERIGTGTKLKLEPMNPGPEADPVRGIHLVARPDFKLGRSRQDADFLTWFWPRTPQNDEMTRRLSRVHAVASIKGSHITIHDSESTNESTFDGQPLREKENGRIGQRGTLLLGGEYAIEVTPYLTTQPGGLQIANEHFWHGPQVGDLGLAGCVRFQPVSSALALYDAVWLFTDANFGSSKVNPVIINLPKVSEAEGRFHYHRGNFWIEAFQGSTIRVDGTALNPGEIVPIVTGQEIVIGGTAFRATVEP